MTHHRSFLALAVVLGGAPAVSANVVTDWDEIAVKTIQAPGPVPPVPGDLAFRASAMVNVAMFDAVNCIEPRYQSYKMPVEPSPDTSRDAAAASAAANVLMRLVPNSNTKTTLTEYLAKLPDGPAKDRGIKLGEEVAATIMKLRADDGSAGPIGYHPWERQIITERDATWEPIDNTPLHPEYPCAHCILSGAVTTVIEKVLGTADIPEVVVSTPTAPGVTHRFTNVNDIADEVAMARNYAGFHYRNSTLVGRDMGHKIGE